MSMRGQGALELELENLMKKSVVSLATLVCTLGLPSIAVSQGLTATGVGAKNRSMGGAATASGLDAAGALHWNPASISAMKKQESVLGLEVLYADSELSSSLPTGEAGVEESDGGLQPIPTLATVFKSSEDSDYTFGVGAYGIAGFRVNYPASTTSPISAPASAGGLGRLVGEAEFMQLAPTVAYEAQPGLSFGIAPTLTLARLRLEPLVFATPNANGTYPSEAGNQYTYGGGFQVGVHWDTGNDLSFGASVKSPQWFDDFEYNSVDENGLPREERLELEYPLIVSTGVAYTGVDNLTLALDLRYFDYANAKGFKEEGFDEVGSVRGLGWDSVFALNLGAEYQWESGWAVRAGYAFNENPISDSKSVFNVASPLIQQHIFSIGGSLPVTENVELALAYLYALENDVDGAIITPQTGAIPGSSVRTELSAHAFAAALHIRH